MGWFIALLILHVLWIFTWTICLQPSHRNPQGLSQLPKQPPYCHQQSYQPQVQRENSLSEMMIHKKCVKQTDLKSVDIVKTSTNLITPNIQKLGISLKDEDIRTHEIKLSNREKTIRYKFLTVLSYVQNNKHNSLLSKSSLRQSWKKQCLIIDTISETPWCESVLQKNYLLSMIKSKNGKYI